MGLIHTEIELKNPRDTDLNPINVTAMADSGALHLCIPQSVAHQLKLEPIYEREITIADGSKHMTPYVGPIQVAFENRFSFTGAFVIGDEVLLGAIPMEDMDVVLSPAEQKVMVNPASPNIPTSVAKGLRV